MIFQHTWQQVLDGAKTQTRRIVQHHHIKAGYNWTRYRVGQIHAVQQGRGKRGIAHIRITEIRQQRLDEISEDDARAELGWMGAYGYLAVLGFANHKPESVRAFRQLWDSIHQTPGTRWVDNPLVWAITFELVKDGSA